MKTGKQVSFSPIKAIKEKKKGLWAAKMCLLVFGGPQ